ncbi:hypothetical protein GW17_00040928 [Ensete ventricosum]|nr:hypothetical protein GW17_00040928 [Ensete ventricosum]RZS12718.1 hypothetical protein BHM03_00044197 [Ensete ventricosum]
MVIKPSGRCIHEYPSRTGNTSTLLYPMHRRKSKTKTYPYTNPTEPHPIKKAPSSGAAITAPNTRCSNGVPNPAGPEGGKKTTASLNGH